ncbi:MAG: TonB-dependent receptor, partial [Bacteroidota bacterium]
MNRSVHYSYCVLRRLQQFFIIFFIFSASTFSSYASTKGELIITIVDNDNQALIGALVEIENTPFKGITDVNGKVSFQFEESGEFKVKVSYLGFERAVQTIKVSNQRSSAVTINMQASSTELEEVVVQGKSEGERVLEQPFKAEFISMKNIRSRPVEVVNLLNQLPGIRVRQNGGVGSDVDISINGIGGKGVKVFVDEIPVYLLGAGYSLNTIPQGIIENISIYKGTIPAKFGSDALGGVVNVTTRQKSSDYLDASYSYGSWNTHQSSLGINKRFGRNRRFNIGIEGFQIYSDNDYWMDNVLVVDEQNSRPGIVNTTRGRARRFNDTFDSKLGRISAGARDLVWADEIQVFSSLSKIDREWQHGVTAENPWGQAFSEETSLSAAMTWKKFSKNDTWDISLAAGFILNQLDFVDTTSRDFRWDQTFEFKPPGLRGESGLFGNGTTPEIETDTYFIRQSSNLRIHTNHHLNLTTLYTVDALLANNPAFATEDQENLREPQDLIKNFTGLSLESDLFGSKLTNILSIKHYYQKSLAVTIDFDGVGPLEDNIYSIFGYGNVFKYQVKPNLVTSLGYEFTIRQPDVEELFGDFIRVLPNPGLAPEESQNINAGLEWSSARRRLKVGGGLFYRKASNRIFLVVVDQANSTYENLTQVETKGVEVDLDYRPFEEVTIQFNSTYFDARALDLNTDRGFSSTQIGKRIPNEPYFFSNLTADYSIPGLPESFGDFNLRYGFNYVHSFLIAWDQNASGQATTPSQ